MEGRVGVGVLVTPEREPRFGALGVRRSKTLSDKGIVTRVPRMREVVGYSSCDEVVIAAEPYNPMHNPAQGVPAIEQALSGKGRRLPPPANPQSPTGPHGGGAPPSRLAPVRAPAARKAEKWALEAPEPSPHVLASGAAFVRARGEEALPGVAKVHFMTTVAIMKELRQDR